MAGDQSQSGANKLKDGVAPALGLVVLLGFGMFVWYLLANLDLSDTEWARATFLFGGVEAVAFGAAGYFFGTQVQRGKVEEAKKEAETAQQVKEAAEASAMSERRASRVLAHGVLESSQQEGGLLSTASTGNSALIAQARALLED